MEWITQPWPWYVSGPLLGLMVPLLLYVTNKPFGVSSNFRHVCAIFSPKSISFFQYDWKKEIWNMVLLAGTIAGGCIAHLYLSPSVTLTLEAQQTLLAEGIPYEGDLLPTYLFSWESLLTVRGWVMMVVGGFLVGFGTRYANGCTSGHAIMGLSMLNVNSLIAVIGFFIGGLLMTYLGLPFIL